VKDVRKEVRTLKQISEEEFLKELRRVLLKEWRMHFKQKLNSLDKNTYISAMSDMLYFSMTQKYKRADLTFSYVFDNIFSIVTRDWKKKIKLLRKQNSIEEILNIEELKVEFSLFLKDVISEMEIFKTEKTKPNLHLINKFVSYINPLFSYLQH